MNNRIDFVDFAKGFAIFGIVVMHLVQDVNGASFFQKVIALGGTGVHLFILLSAFGLTLSGMSGPVSFYKRRFIKILIPYYIVVVIIFIFNAFTDVKGSQSLNTLFSHLFFYKMFNNDLIISLGYHFWFLSTLFQFYIFYPLFRWLMGKINVWVFLGCAIVISVSYWIFLFVGNLVDQRAWTSAFPAFLWEFVLGMILAEQYKKNGYMFWKQKTRYLLLSIVVGLGSMALLVLKFGSFGKVFNDVPAFWGYTAFTILIYKLSIETNWLKVVKDAFIKLSSYSYTLYLIHMFLIQVLYFSLIDFFKISYFPIYLRILYLPLILIISYLLEKIFKMINRKIDLGVIGSS